MQRFFSAVALLDELLPFLHTFKFEAETQLMSLPLNPVCTFLTGISYNRTIRTFSLCLNITKKQRKMKSFAVILKKLRDAQQDLLNVNSVLKIVKFSKVSEEAMVNRRPWRSLQVISY